MARVVVVGGGPGGATAARILAERGIETTFFEKSPTKPKPCGGAIPPLLVREFHIPPEVVDTRMRYTTIHSPTSKQTNIEVVGTVPSKDDYIGMVRREVFDNYLREQARAAGAREITAAVKRVEFRTDSVAVIYEAGRDGQEQTIVADAVIGADGAYSIVAKSLGLERGPQTVAMQYRIQLPPDKMAYWNERAELYLGQDVSPDFYGWIFPKKDHLTVGIGAGPDNSQRARQFLNNLKDRVGDKFDGARIVATEAHALPMRRKKQMAFDRALLVGDAAGLVVHTSGEGIYWAMKSGELAAQTLAAHIHAPTAANLASYQKTWNKQYGSMYSFLERLEKVYYGKDSRFEMFTEMCRDYYVQRLTFDSYLHKQMAKTPFKGALQMGGKMVVAAVKYRTPVSRLLAARKPKATAVSPADA